MNAPLPPFKQDPLWLQPLLTHAQEASPQASLFVIFGEDKWPKLDLWSPDEADLAEIRHDIAEVSIYTVDRNYWTASRLSQGFHPSSGYFQSDISIAPLSYKYDAGTFAHQPYPHGFYEQLKPATSGLIYLPYRHLSYATYFEKVWHIAPADCSAEAQKNIIPAIASHELGHYLHSTQPFETPVCDRLGEIIADRTIKLGSALLKEDIFTPHQAWRRLQVLRSDFSSNSRIYWSWQSIAAEGDLYDDFMTHTKELQAVWELKTRAAHTVLGTPFQRLGASLYDLGHGQGLIDFYNTLAGPDRQGLLHALPRLVAADNFLLAETRTLARQTLAAAVRFVPKLVAAA